jgi:hypothetical protein
MRERARGGGVPVVGLVSMPSIVGRINHTAKGFRVVGAHPKPGLAADQSRVLSQGPFRSRRRFGCDNRRRRHRVDGLEGGDVREVLLCAAAMHFAGGLVSVGL